MQLIFVTVGTHEQQFDRLIKCIDELKGKGTIEDEVFIQVGFSSYKPIYCKWSKIISYKEMVSNVKNARIVITHGGPASFIMPLQIGKIPIVVPRQHSFDEHVNDHQVDFSKAVALRMGTIIPIYDLQKLEEVLINYDDIIVSMPSGLNSNNAEFNKRLDKIVRSLFSEG